jgi:hypothetical protein
MFRIMVYIMWLVWILINWMLHLEFSAILFDCLNDTESDNLELSQTDIKAVSSSKSQYYEWYSRNFWKEAFALIVKFLGDRCLLSDSNWVRLEDH